MMNLTLSHSLSLSLSKERESRVVSLYGSSLVAYVGIFSNFYTSVYNNKEFVHYLCMCYFVTISTFFVWQAVNQLVQYLYLTNNLS